MINKFNKTINNKFSGFFKFVFFLRYPAAILFVASSLFLIIPQFFDYKKKEQIIMDNLLQNYGLEIKELGNINFNSFPAPNIKIKDLKSNFFLDDIDLKSDEIIIYPKLVSIYNFKNFQINKIKLKKTNVVLDQKNTKFFFQKILSLKKKIYFDQLNLNIRDKGRNILFFKKVNFYNYGYKKDVVEGELFEKKFDLILKDGFDDIKFKIPEIGVFAELNILENDEISKFNGSLKGKILKSNFKLDFIYNDESIQILNFFFRDKTLSLDSNGSLLLKPFFKINLNSEIRSIDTNILKNLNINTLLKQKDLIRRINSNIEIIFKSRTFSKDLVSDLKIKTDLAYGRLVILKKFSISKSNFNCKSNINLLEKYPILYFNCSMSSPDKKDFYNSFKIDYKNKNETILLNFKGNLNILNKKINFDLIELNENYKANNEDLKYFKSTFENIVFDKNFIKVFNLEKIKRFILEIS